MIRSHQKTIYEILGREPVHPFPARMAPGIALEVVGEPKKPLRVLDPMMGSGTVLAVARSKGHQAIGIDIDPLAVLISKVWTTAINPEEVRDKATEVLDRARGIFSALPTRDAYPRHPDPETRRFVLYWFDDYARRQLTALATAIACVRDDVSRDVLWCAFSRLIITKQSGASLAMDLSHSRPHKSFDRAPAKPFKKFLAAVDRVVKNCIDKNSVGCGPATCTYEGDARGLPLDDTSIDLVLTSPPYLNAIDYMRCSKFSLVWMGHRISELRRLRADIVGAEMGDRAAQGDQDIRGIAAKLKLRPALAARDEAVLVRYITDMRRAVREVARVLAPGGKAVYVVGENTIRGTYIRNSLIVSAVAELAGLKCQDRRIRTLPANRRYLPPPHAGGGSAALDRRMRREVVLEFTKPAV
jgi:DNA modification methylase